jgi:hypothetical protein
LLAVPASAAPDNELFNNRVMVGYQAWFLTPGSGPESEWEEWRHWSQDRQMLTTNNAHFDMWPDFSEYKELYPTKLRYKDGREAGVYSALDYSTVDLHFTSSAITLRARFPALRIPVMLAVANASYWLFGC